MDPEREKDSLRIQRFCKYLQVTDVCQIYVADETNAAKSDKTRQNEMRQGHDLHGDETS